ncbi:branched-chain amino acid ABC transporter permease [Sulfitobacter sp. S190]|uniref:branched-chain amino acid ABC transporter permease n=1 Tax=Sulfitobacter sp. S190 TaxID=2867022 RepID=UPI0021A507DE|nr:branched-chain amino acid ABC transporter permease [Sulfitobacter sp. S190]UWR23174.1 branched-chain amino acid ABC transporter permease [Sulfitobacter sp. S190]
MDIINAVVQGVLLGGLYALFAAGLSLMFGVMRFVNIAHGDFIVVAAYLGFTAILMLGLHPAAGIGLVVLVMGAAGYGGQRVLLNRVLGKDILPPILVTFGISIILQNGLLELYSADSRRVSSGALETASFALGEGLSVGLLPVLMFGVAVAVIGGLHLVFFKTALGRLLRATSDDPEIVPLMGGSNAHAFGLATMLASAVVGIAGILLAMKTNFDPTMGPSRLLFAFEAVIIGGLGSIWGTLVGGILLGVAQTVSGYIDPGLQVLAGHLVFLLVLVLRPQGLMPKGGA